MFSLPVRKPVTIKRQIFKRLWEKIEISHILDILGLFLCIFFLILDYVRNSYTQKHIPTLFNISLRNDLNLLK